MNFQCNAKQLRDAIACTQPVTTKHTGLTILNSILLSVTKDTGVLRATNLSFGIEYSFSAKVTSEGIVALNGALLSDILGTLNQDELIKIEQSGNTIILNTTSTKSKIKTIPHEDFPILPKISEGKSFDVPAKEFVTMLVSVIYAASLSDIKPEISSLYMFSDNDNLVCVTTDSFRLAEKKLYVPNLPNFDGIMIPIKNISILIRSMSEVTENITITISTTQITFTTNKIYCVSRLVDGQYPDYRQIIPRESTTEIIMLKQDLANALHVLNIFSDKFNQVDVVVQHTNKTCTMTSENTEIGHTDAQITCAITGEDIETRFNARYIQDCLPSLSGDSISISFTTPQKPIVVKPVGSEDFVYLVMPMHR